MTLARDIRQAARQLRGSPGYAAAAILTFAVTIAANAAIFSAVNAVLLRPLPIDRPENLHVVWQTDEGGQAVIELTHRHLREWTEHGRAFTSAALMGSHNWSGVLQNRGEPSRIWFNGVSHAFFDVLGTKPALGRAFRQDDDLPNARPVAVLSHAAWRRRFGGDPSVVGTTMTLDGNPLEIVGVMPEDFEVPRGAEFWIPVVPILASGTPPNTSALDRVGVSYVVARVHDGVDAPTLARDLDALEARLDGANPGRLKWGTRSVVTPFDDFVFGPVRPALRALWIAVGVLLLIACANVSGLMLTRVSRRRHENAVRVALGAPGGALARLWAFEILIVGLAGGVVGTLAAQWLTGAIVALAPDDLPRIADVRIDPSVVIFSLVIVLVASLLAAIVPIRAACRDSLLPMEGERATAGQAATRLRGGLVLVQIALSVVLLVAAGLVLRSFVALRSLDLGFVPDQVLSLTVEPGNPGRPPNEWLDEWLKRVRSARGVEAAGAVFLRPLMLGPIGQGAHVVLEGQPETAETADANPTLNYQIASVGYFETLRIPLRAGRLFSDADNRNAPRVAIVSESAARRLWPGRDPIGRRFATSAFTPGTKGLVWRTVVGVVSDVRYRGLDEVQLDIYDPALQAGLPANNVVVRTQGNPVTLAPLVAALARELDPTVIVDGITTMDAVVSRAEAPWRLTMWMFVLFAGLAFALAALGLFSLVALDVTHRQREFAIRSALGESRAAVSRGVLRRAGWWIAGGLSAGFAVAFVVTRTMRSLLFGIDAYDAATYAGVAALVTVVVAAASYIPARRAGRVEPQKLLRA